MPRQPKPPISTRKATLLAQKAVLEARLVAIEQELDSHQNRDWEDLAVEREGDEVLEASGLSGQYDLRQIEAALHRIETAEYGICAKCGAEIEEHRLDVLPATPLCRDCAT
jgi:RNA polymerase-binding transcription factor DksA